MRVLIVGGGGREHALAWKLRQSPRLKELYCAPGNAGIARLATRVPIGPTEVGALTDFAEAQKIDLVVVGPEAPLASGLVDALAERGILAFGPRRAAAAIESSKSFAKEIMARADIPTASAAVFTDYNEAMEHVASVTPPIVIKADGLAAGKGVIIAKTHAEAQAALNEMLNENAFGAAGQRVLIEQFLVGEEVSVLGVTDGRRVHTLVPARDYKRVFDNNEGPNTGGMGAFAPVPGLPDDFEEYVHKTIMEPAIAALAEVERPFRGVLYAGLMLTEDGVYVLEFNARFGDPETQVVLPLYRGDLLDLLQAAAEGDLPERPSTAEQDDRQQGTTAGQAAVSVVLASGGYPSAYETGVPIYGLEQLADSTDQTVFHAGTEQQGDQIVTAGGRVLNVVAWADDLRSARERAYAAVKNIRFEGMHYRRDIALLED